MAEGELIVWLTKYSKLCGGCSAALERECVMGQSLAQHRTASS